MSLREDIERQMHEAAGRSTFLLNQGVYGPGKHGDPPVQFIMDTLQALSDLNAILTEVVLRLANEIDELK